MKQRKLGLNRKERKQFEKVFRKEKAKKALLALKKTLEETRKNKRIKTLLRDKRTNSGRVVFGRASHPKTTHKK